QFQQGVSPQGAHRQSRLAGDDAYEVAAQSVAPWAVCMAAGFSQAVALARAAFPCRPIGSELAGPGARGGLPARAGISGAVLCTCAWWICDARCAAHSILFVRSLLFLSGQCGQCAGHRGCLAWANVYDMEYAQDVPWPGRPIAILGE